MSSKLVTWVDDSVEFFGEPIRLKLKLPPFKGSIEFVKRIAALQATINPEDAFESENLEWIQRVFETMVRLPEPVEYDGATITDGPALLEVGNLGLVFRVLGRLRNLVFMTEKEGKASASPSTPSVDGESKTAGSSSPAPSTGPEAGPMS